MPTKTKATKKPETCWERADRNIKRYHKALKDGSMDPARARKGMNEWLDYRLNHSESDCVGGPV